MILAPWFDSLLIGGCALAALAAGLALTMRPSLLAALVAIDVVFLAYPHVVATYTRLGFDPEIRRDGRFLFTALPILVLAGAALIGRLFGAWCLATLYVYWQSFHYFRQSYGIARIYERKAVGGSPRDPVATAMIYLVPVWGILYRSYQQPSNLLGIEIRLVPVPCAVVAVVGAAAIAAACVWAFRCVRLYREKRLPVAQFLYVLTHLAVFAVGYLLIADNSRGWVVLNCWHNLQYILIVWVAHHGSLRGGARIGQSFLAAMAKDGGRLPLFAGFCFVVSYAMYRGLYWSTASSSVLGVMIVSQSINIHHYIVDGAVWRLSKPAVRAELRLTA
jgi:hypothetical protein